MERTAVVINAGIGDLSMGLSMAGFRVLAAFKADEKALRIHASNIVDVPVFQREPSDVRPDDVP